MMRWRSSISSISRWTESITGTPGGWGCPTPQRELCGSWSYPPQTVNSALKGLERQGLLALVPRLGNRKDKEMVLTPAGREYVRRAVEPLMETERQALSSLGDGGREQLFSLTRRYIRALETGTDRLPAPAGDGEKEYVKIP